MIDKVFLDEITQHLLRYGMTTADVVAACLWSDQPGAEIDARLASYLRAGILVRHRLVGGANYFVLAPRWSGVAFSDRPLTASALVERYGILLAATKRQCDVMTAEEFQQFFPGYVNSDTRGLSLKGFFIDESQATKRIGWFLVDHDKDARRLVCKARRRIDQIYRNALPPFHDAIQQGRLAITIVTATDGKMRNIQKILARKTPTSTAILVESHPELEQLFILGNR